MFVLISLTKHSLINLISTPLYQVVSHALSDKSNKTKFTLLFSNVTEKDILLREELDALRKQHPDKFEIIYLLDIPEKSWTGAPFFLRLMRHLLADLVSLRYLYRSIRLYLSRCNQAICRPCLLKRETENFRLRYAPPHPFLKHSTYSFDFTRAPRTGSRSRREESWDEAGRAWWHSQGTWLY